MMKGTSSRTGKVLSYLLLAMIACVITMTRVGDWNIRMAMVSADDGLQAASIYFARTKDFAADVYMQAWVPMTFASAATWIPAFAYKYLHIHPAFFFEALTIGQAVGLALAMFHFSLVVTRSQILAWLTATMTICWHPQFLNLALLGGLEWMPYANWIALPFLVFAFSSIYQDHRFRSYASLLIGTLIHPIMGLLATALVAPFIAYEGLMAKNLRLIVEAASASAIVALFAVVPVTLSTHGVSFVHGHIVWLLNNQHVRPWGAEYPYGIASFVSSALCIGALVALANTRDRFFIVALVMTCIMTAAHFLAVLLLISQAMEIIASRSTILLVLAALPFVAANLWDAVRSGNPAKITTVAIAMFRANAITLIAATLAVRGGRIGAVIGATMSVAVVIGHLLSASGVAILGPGAPWLLGNQNLVSFSWIGLAIGLAGAALASRSYLRAGGAMIVAALLVSAGLGAYMTKIYPLSSPQYADYAAAQIWARDNTPPNSTFTLLQTVPEYSWRTLSERPVVAALPIFTAYRLPSSANDYNNRLFAFHLQKTSSENLNDLRDLDETYWQAFAKEFGADFLVRRTDWPALDFPEVYHNPSFLIYQVRPTP